MKLQILLMYTSTDFFVTHFSSKKHRHYTQFNLGRHTCCTPSVLLHLDSASIVRYELHLALESARSTHGFAASRTYELDFFRRANSALFENSIKSFKMPFKSAARKQREARKKQRAIEKRQASAKLHRAPVDTPIIATGKEGFGKWLKYQTPHPQDFVFVQAAKVIEMYNSSLSPIEKFAGSMRLEALNAAAATIPIYGCESSPTVHALVREGQVIKVQLKLSRDLLEGWEHSAVMLKDGDRWILLHEYLDGLEPVVSMTGQSGYEIQYNWWKSMCRPFEILKMPQELQDRIWLFAVGERIDPFILNDCGGIIRVSLVQGTRIDHIYHRSKDPGINRILDVEPVNQSLLRLNKSTHHNIKKVLKTHTTVFWDMEYRDNWFQCCFPEEFGASIYRVQLAMNYKKLVETFRVRTLPFNIADDETLDRTTPSFRTISKAMPNLKFVEIFFKSDVELSEVGHYNEWLTSWNPRKYWDGLIWKPDVPDYAALGIEFDRPPCHKVMQDWIMAFAADYLSDIRTVRLTGLIKTCVKEKWEAIINGSESSENEMEIARVQKEAREAHPTEL